MNDQNEDIKRIILEIESLKEKHELKEYFDQKISSHLKILEDKVFEKVKTETDKTKWIWRGLGVLGISSVIAAWNLYNSLYKAVYDAARDNLTSQISHEFQSQRISDEIDKFAKKYTESTAKSLIENQVSDVLFDFKRTVQGDIDSYKKLVKKDLLTSSSQIKSLVKDVSSIEKKTLHVSKNIMLANEKSETLLQTNLSMVEIEKLSAAAKNDSFEAYIQLCDLSEDKNLNSTLRETALSKVFELKSIIQSYMETNLPNNWRLTFKKDGKEVNAEDLSTEELKSYLLGNVMSSTKKIYVKDALLKRSEKEILETALDIYKNGSSLYSAALMMQVLGDRYGLSLGLNERTNFVKWLNKKLKEYKK